MGSKIANAREQSAQEQLRRLRGQLNDQERVLVVGQHVRPYQMSLWLKGALVLLSSGVGLYYLAFAILLLVHTPQIALDILPMLRISEVLFLASMPIFLITLVSFVAVNWFVRKPFVFYLITNQRIFRSDMQESKIVGLRTDIQKIQNSEKGVTILMSNGDRIKLDTVGGLELNPSG